MIENLSVGPHYFEVRALGANGSRDSTPELEEWLIIPPLDTTGPITTIAIAPGPLSGPDVSFGFQADELVEEFECMLDGEEWAGCDAILEMTDLLPGEHELEVRAYDIWENVGPSARHTWTSVGEPDTLHHERPRRDQPGDRAGHPDLGAARRRPSSSTATSPT